MENTLLVGLSRQIALAREADILANNVANVATTGFKRRDVRFMEYLMPVARGDAFKPADKRISYVQERGTGLDVSQGAVERTGNPLDIAMRGNTFLAVQTRSGERYTRDGALNLNARGEVVTSAGDVVLGESGPIAFSPQEGRIEIAADGTVSSSQGVRGRLKLMRFDNPNLALRNEGDNLYSAIRPGVPIDKDGGVVPGALEKSNVKPVIEMSRLIEVSRAYQSIAGMIQRVDELRRSAIQKLADVPA
ncbi:MAG: flagellar basal-body rod protein FlgF [Beijerinckiaceae bacterium]